MRTIAGPAAFCLSVVLAIALAVIGLIESFSASAHPALMDKHAAVYAAALVDLGKLDLKGVQNGAEKYGLPPLEYQADAPAYSLAHWLNSAHRGRHPARALAWACFGASVVAGVIAALVWIQRPAVRERAA